MFVKLKTGRRAGEVVEMKFADARALIQAEQAEPAYQEPPAAGHAAGPPAPPSLPSGIRPKAKKRSNA